MSFSKMEGFLEKHIEGFFNRRFASDLQFAEIEKNLEHLLGREQKKQDGRIFIPNNYTIEMADSDYEHLCSARTRTMLREFLVKTAIYSDLFIKGEIKLEFAKAAKLKRGACNIVGQFLPHSSSNAENDTLSQDTIIAQHPDDTLLAAKLPDYNYASLRVELGNDAQSTCLLGEKRIHIGRREENEFLLTDPNASRLHAYIAFEDGRHALYDANSLNGTFVNDKAVQKAFLCDGDMIEIGRSKIFYEVLP